MEMVVLKNDERGCEVHTAAGCERLRRGFPVSVVDTTATVDSFADGFLRVRNMGHSLEECAQFANTVGAVMVQKLGGGCSMPASDEIAALLSRFQLSRPPRLF